MMLRPGDRLGPYTIIEAVDTGGMGQIFKAEDTRLGRFVAVKVIAHEREDLEESRQRFASEGRAIAALNHSHICALYDTGFDRGRPYLVMEYLQGETLAARLARGRLSMREVIGWAIEIADALDYAHRHGILHRDLKPANVFITQPGGAKLLDFGLSAMRGAADAALARLATEPVRLTAEGSIIGTLHYLAPERLDGAAADGRSDVYAFGAVLYEMLNGRRPFDEPTHARLIAAILRGEPAPPDFPPGTPAELQTIVTVALSRNPDDRWQSMADVAKILKGIAGRLATRASEIYAERRSKWPVVVPTAAAAALAVVLAVLTLNRSKPAAPEPVISFAVPPPDGGAMGLTDASVQTAQFALSPDGRSLAFVASLPGGGRRLWLRRLDDIEARPLKGSDGASYPFWSPDGRYIAFFAEARLKRIPMNGGPAEDLCEATNGRGGTWNRYGDIVFAPNIRMPLHRVSAAGGQATPLLALGAAHDSHRFPQFLPDGRHLVFLVKSPDTSVEGIYFTSLDAPAGARRVRAASTNGLYASGRLFYVLDGSLLVQPFDPTSGALSGESEAVGPEVSGSSSFYSAFSVSDAGVLATWAAGNAVSELVWFDRKGNQLSVVDSPGYYIDFRLSPDQTRLAFARVDPGSASSDLWMVDLRRGVPVRLASSPETDATPIWSKDGNLVFRSNRRGIHELFQRPANPGGEERLVFEGPAGAYPTDFSSDGGVLYHMRGRDTGYDVRLVDLATKKTRAIADTPFEEAQGQLAADGRIAFTSNASGQLDIHVGALDRARDAMRVSSDGSFDPRWSGDGKELFYLTPKGKVMVAPFPKGDLDVGRIEELFSVATIPTSSPYLSQFVVTRDGQRFLIKVPIQRLDSRAITVTRDWRRRLSPQS